MNEVQQIEARRNSIVEELLAIHSLRQGSINEQWFPIVRNGKKTKQMRGPYFVLSYKEDKKTVSIRLNDEEVLEQAKIDTQNHRRFKGLCGELEELTQRLGELKRKQGDEVAKLKKKPKLRSSKAKK